MGFQDRTVWALIDTGASRNLTSQRDYEALPQRPTLRPPGSLMFVPGNNQEIPLLGWITLRFTINTRSLPFLGNLASPFLVLLSVFN